MNTINFLTLEQWCKRNQLAPKIAKCESCDGKGKMRCNLGHIHDCDRCGGDGESMDYSEHRQEYIAQKKIDIKLLESVKP